MKHTVFVYGTLRSGWGNNRLIENQTLIDEAISNEYYRVAVSGFPLAELSNEDDVQASQMIGELWEVDDQALARMDGLEGHPHFYCRHLRMFVPINHSDPIEAWVYEINSGYVTDSNAVTKKDYLFNFSDYSKGDW